MALRVSAGKSEALQPLARPSRPGRRDLDTTGGHDRTLDGSGAGIVEDEIVRLLAQPARVRANLRHHRLCRQLEGLHGEALALHPVARLLELLHRVIDGGGVTGRTGRAVPAVLVRDPLQGIEMPLHRLDGVGRRGKGEKRAGTHRRDQPGGKRGCDAPERAGK